MKRKRTLWIGLLGLILVLAAGCTQADDLKVGEIWARPGDQGANSAVYFIIENNSAEADTLLSAESDIADAVELHESMIQPVDEGQGKLAKPLEDETHEHMEDHHPDDHHADCDLEDQEGCEHLEGDHQEGEHHDEHHPDSEMSANTVETSMGIGLEGGVMTMVQQENVPVEAQSQVQFKPGGLHVMLIGLKQELNPGDSFTIRLNFEKAGQITLDVTVSTP
jgi:copper(I)-binding protein